MLIRHPLAVGACLTMLLTAGCGQRGPDAPASASALATVGGATVSADEVRALFSPTGEEMPVRLATGPVDGAGGVDALDQALRAAVNDELLALEAERQGIDGVNRAHMLSRLIDRQVRPEIEDFDRDQVRSWYGEHRYLFDHVEAADLDYVVLDSPASLDAVFAALRDPREEVGNVVEAFSAVEGGRLVMAHDGDEVPLMVERIVNADKQRGAISYDRDPATGHWWVVEVVDMELAPTPWTPEFATKVEEAMTWEAEQSLISSLAAELEKEWPVVVHEDNIERFDRSLRGE
ncbi:MAG: PPIC-type protein [Modestobacter sp.]|nr:PPIC-type protein [Modestobacter sp.]